jgi:hypothetical protein
MTGKPYVGYPKYFPAGLSATGEEIKDAKATTSR